MLGNDEIKRIWETSYSLHSIIFELVSYIYNAFIVRHKITCLPVTFN